MRRISLEELQKDRKAKMAIALEVESLYPKRLAGRRPRDPEKEELLIKLEKARRQKMIDSGKLEIIGPRHWKLHISFD